LSQLDFKSQKSGVRALIIGIISIITMVAFQQILPPFVLPLLFFWVVPFMVTVRVERKKLGSLGITYGINRTPMYFLSAVLGFILLTGFLVSEHYVRIHFLGEVHESVFMLDQGLLEALLLQIVGIGLPEEIFFRGYLLSRLNMWLGKGRGLIISSFLFGFGHFASRLFQYGFRYIFSAIATGLQTLLAGIVLGYLFYRTESVFPPAASHILLNLFGPSISIQLLR